MSRKKVKIEERMPWPKEYFEKEKEETDEEILDEVFRVKVSQAIVKLKPRNGRMASHPSEQRHML